MRKPSDTTMKTRAFRAFVDADARAKKADAAMMDAARRCKEAVAARDAAREACVKLGVPISEQKP